MSNPLPEPAIILHGKRGKQMSPEAMDFYTADQMRAHAAAEVEASRDCRTCVNVSKCETRCHTMHTCVNGDRYEALPVLRLWRTSK